MQILVNQQQTDSNNYNLFSTDSYNRDHPSPSMYKLPQS